MGVVRDGAYAVDKSPVSSSSKRMGLVSSWSNILADGPAIMRDFKLVVHRDIESCW